MEKARSSLDIVNYDVRAAIGAAEARSANSSQPAEAFAQELKEQVLGKDGLRNRYLQQADGGRGTFDLSSPITSMEKSSLLRTGRFTLDPGQGPGDGDSSFKNRQR
jgi:conjugal transfer mating pair stabilization protein TraG